MKTPRTSSTSSKVKPASTEREQRVKSSPQRQADSPRSLKPIESLPREITVTILQLLRPADVVELLKVSRRFRCLFSLSPKEYVFAKQQLERHYLDGVGSSSRPAYFSVPLRRLPAAYSTKFTIAFRHLPMAYSLALISLIGFREEMIAMAFPDDVKLEHGPDSKSSMAFSLILGKPFRQPLRVDLLVRKALGFGLLDFSIDALPIKRPTGEMFPRCLFAFHVSAKLDSADLTLDLIASAASKLESSDRPKLHHAAMLAACIGGAEKVATRLLSPQTDAYADAVDPNLEVDGRSLLSIAIELGRESIARILVAHGADVNLRSGTKGFTPLHYAAQLDHLGIGRFLLEKGADVNCKDNNQRAPLVLAVAATCAQRSCEFVKLLVENGADIDVADENGYTPLHHFAKNDNEHMVDFLLDHACDDEYVDGTSKEDETPLILAAQNGCYNIAQTLISRGADVFAVDGFGRTARDRAKEKGYIDLADMLEWKEKKPRRYLSRCG
ncbi:hypothetical protein HDU96_008122 [Phlyctochytrium bullatum]|nr:hypothetical protein HDU96_008122 [Phlyctochytrium bullatum]